MATISMATILCRGQRAKICDGNVPGMRMPPLPTPSAPLTPEQMAQRVVSTARYVHGKASIVLEILKRAGLREPQAG